MRRACWYGRWRGQDEIGRGEVKHKLNRGFFYNFCTLCKIGKFIKGKMSMVIIPYTNVGTSIDFIIYR